MLHCSLAYSLQFAVHVHRAVPTRDLKYKLLDSREHMQVDFKQCNAYSQIQNRSVQHLCYHHLFCLDV